MMFHVFADMKDHSARDLLARVRIGAWDSRCDKSQQHLRAVFFRIFIGKFVV